jgi:hypothetical protein
MAGVIRAYVAILAALVGHQVRFLGKMFVKDGLECVSHRAENVEGTRPAVAFDQRKDRVFMGYASAGNPAALSPYKGFIGFHGATTATQQPGSVGFHRFSDAVSHEPSSLVLNVKRSLKLMGATSLLARADQIDSLQPLMKGNLAALKHGSHGYGKLLAAILAFPQTRAMRFALQFVVLFAHAATVRAYRAIGPAYSLKVLACFVGVLVVGLVEGGSHD